MRDEKSFLELNSRNVFISFYLRKIIYFLQSYDLFSMNDGNNYIYGNLICL